MFIVCLSSDWRRKKKERLIKLKEKYSSPKIIFIKFSSILFIPICFFYLKNRYLFFDKFESVILQWHFERKAGLLENYSLILRMRYFQYQSISSVLYSP